MLTCTNLRARPFLSLEYGVLLDLISRSPKSVSDSNIIYLDQGPILVWKAVLIRSKTLITAILCCPFVWNSQQVHIYKNSMMPLDDDAKR